MGVLLKFEFLQSENRKPEFFYIPHTKRLRLRLPLSSKKGVGVPFKFF